MRIATLIIMVLVMATAALAEKAPYEASNNAPVVSERQGGDTIADATPIANLPFAGSGTTLGYANDYDEVCPYTGSTSADVVYELLPCMDGALTFTLCVAPTDYDTKMYIYDAAGGLVDCNDDSCTSPAFPSPYVSYLAGVPVTGGEVYYLVIDGYGGQDGNYGLEITGMDCTTPVDEETFSVVKSLY